MTSLYAHLDRLGLRCARYLADYSIPLLRISLGLVFLGFGVLKFVPGLSPAEPLVEETVGELTFGLMPDSLGMRFVAALESVIGLCLVVGRYLRLGVALLGMAMVGILSPLVLIPEQLFNLPTFAPTLAGQYVLKDIVLLAAGLVVTANVLGARMVARHDASAPHQGDVVTQHSPHRTSRPRIVLSRREPHAA
jgi:putative oxidoreductase